MDKNFEFCFAMELFGERANAWLKASGFNPATVTEKERIFLFPRILLTVLSVGEMVYAEYGQNSLADIIAESNQDLMRRN